MTREELLVNLANQNLNKEFNLTKDQHKAVAYFFKAHVKNGGTWEDLKDKIGEQKYNYLVEFTKLKFSDYYHFQEIISFNSKDLVLIFENCVVVFDKIEYSTLSKKYGESCVSEVAIIFEKVINFCVDNKMSNNEFKKTLIDYYDCPNEIADLLMESFEKNRLFLMVQKILLRKPKN